MPLTHSYYPSSKMRHFRSLIFSNNLEILFEHYPEEYSNRIACDIALFGNVPNVNYITLKYYIQKLKKGKLESFQLTDTLSFDLTTMTICVKGYELRSFDGGNTYMCSSMSDKVFSIPIDFPLKDFITTLEYFYHVATTV